MLKVYHSFKIALLISFLLIVVGILFYENTKEYNFDYGKNAIISQLLDSYKVFKASILDDPYNKTIVTKVENSKENFKKIFNDLFTAMSNLTSDKSFYNGIFIYMVSKNMDGMEYLAKSRFSIIPSFKDLIIIDKNKNVLYKYGNNSFVAEFYDVTNDMELKFFGEDLGIIKNYDDPTTDYKIEIIALFDHEAIAKQLKGTEYPAFFIMNDKVYKNSSALPEIFNKIQNDLNNERKYYVGLKVVETMVLMRDNFYIGTFGITYPSRSLGSSLLILLKIIILLIVFIILLSFDNFIEKKLRILDNWKKDLPFTGAGKFTIESNESKENEASLDWVKMYIQNTEGKK